MIDRLRDSNFAAGALFLCIGIVAFFLSSDLAVGSASRMGPGYLPRVFSGLVAGFGIVLIAFSFREPARDLAGFKPKPFVAILLGIAAFAFAIERLGLVCSVVILVLVAGLGSRDMTWRALFATALLLAVVSFILFVQVLDLTLPVWPWWMR